MKEGTTFHTFELFGRWPVDNNTILLESIQKTYTLKTTALPQGNLLIELLIPREDPMYLISQTIEFVDLKRIILSVKWENKSMEVRINGNLLESYESKSIHRVLSNPNIVSDVLSWDDKDCMTDCKVWMDWRKNRYSSLKSVPRLGRRLKTIHEQINELKKSLEILTKLTEETRKGEYDYIPIILPLLRSLILWSEKSSNYNPILIRIAGFLKLPLPIYALPPIDTDNPGIEHILSQGAIHITSNFPSVTKTLPKQKLMDFQEWLNMKVLSIDTEANRMIDVLFKATNSSSIAHFDDDIPEEVDLLEKHILLNNDMLKILILDVSQITIYLGKHIIPIAEDKYK